MSALISIRLPATWGSMTLERGAFIAKRSNHARVGVYSAPDTGDWLYASVRSLEEKPRYRASERF
jgi:hypothetical protein